MIRRGQVTSLRESVLLLFSFMVFFCEPAGAVVREVLRATVSARFAQDPPSDGQGAGGADSFGSLRVYVQSTDPERHFPDAIVALPKSHFRARTNVLGWVFIQRVAIGTAQLTYTCFPIGARETTITVRPGENELHITINEPARWIVDAGPPGYGTLLLAVRSKRGSRGIKHINTYLRDSSGILRAERTDAGGIAFFEDIREGRAFVWIPDTLGHTGNSDSLSIRPDRTVRDTVILRLLSYHEEHRAP